MLTKQDKLIIISVGLILSLMASSVGAGFRAVPDCCCSRKIQTAHHKSPLNMEMPSKGCCPVADECRCAFKSDIDFSGKLYMVSPFPLSGKDVFSVYPLADTNLNRLFGKRIGKSSSPPEFQARSVPIFLQIQSFLC